MSIRLPGKLLLLLGSALLAPARVSAHECGQTLYELSVGQTAEYTIGAFNLGTNYRVTNNLD
ncbi:MAG: hypothetical protein HY650_05165 [Acidobacteria bacterium]|nr:hypothetical protein [Acidobacteriota bacterium]